MQLTATFGRLMKRSNYVWGVVARFFYVRAQIGVWSYTLRYVMEELNFNEEESATYYLAALVVFMISRFIRTVLMKYIRLAYMVFLVCFIVIAV